MARINIDDELHADRDFKRLVRALNGDEDRAVGLVYRFWRAAQDYWGKEMSAMPVEEFEMDGFAPLHDCGLAVLRNDGYTAKDAAERFDWYLQRCRAGKRGGRPAEDKKEDARRELWRAIREGRIERRTICEDCGNDKRAIEAHHPDYDKPLEVRWLCRPCHRTMHKLIRAAKKPDLKGRLSAEESRLTGDEAPPTGDIPPTGDSDWPNNRPHAAENPTATATATASDQKTTTATTSRAHARDEGEGGGKGQGPPKEPTGPIPELADVVGADVMLSSIKHSIQRDVWVKVFTLAVVRAELSLAYSKWLSDDARRLQGNVQLYLNTWFQNELKAMARGGAARASPTAKPPQPKELVWVRFEDFICREREEGEAPFVSLPRKYYDDWKKDFEAGRRGGMPPPIVGIGPNPPNKGGASVIPITGKGGTG